MTKKLKEEEEEEEEWLVGTALQQELPCICTMKEPQQKNNNH